MEQDSDELGSEWETLKGLPATKTSAEDIDLRREYMSMGEFPEFVYKIVDANYGLRYASIWRMKCYGTKRRGRPVYARDTECWVVQYDIALWKGEMADNRSVPVPHPRDLNRIFMTPKKDSYTTYAELTAAFIVARDKALAEVRDNVKRWKADIARLQGDVANYEAHEASMRDFVPDLDAVRDREVSSP